MRSATWSPSAPGSSVDPLRSAPRHHVIPGAYPAWASWPTRGAGAAARGGRFNREGVEALYLSLDEVTALREYQQTSPFLPPCTMCSYRWRCETWWTCASSTTGRHATSYGTTATIRNCRRRVAAGTCRQPVRVAVHAAHVCMQRRRELDLAGALGQQLRPIPEARRAERPRARAPRSTSDRRRHRYG
jgi:hypothetical protein